MAENSLNQAGLVVIGGSAGSLNALIAIFRQLKNAISLPIVLVLHRKPIQDTLLVDILSDKTRFLIKEAEEKEQLLPETVYIAPADYHLLIEKDHTLSLDASEKVNYSRPSIDVTFESAADVYGSKLVAVLLSGANADGVKGLRRVMEAGGRIIIQRPSTAEMPYMPQQALLQRFDAEVLSPEEIGNYLALLLN